MQNIIIENKLYEYDDYHIIMIKFMKLFPILLNPQLGEID